MIQRQESIEVSISVDTVDREKMDWIAGFPDCLRRISDFLDCLNNHRVNVIAVLTTVNQGEIAKVIDWVAGRDICCLTINKVLRQSEYAPGPKDLEQFWKCIRRKREEYRDRLAIRTVGFRQAKGETCGAGRNLLFIDSTGCVLPCTATENARYREIVMGKSIKEIVDLYQRIVPDFPQSCCYPSGLGPVNRGE